MITEEEQIKEMRREFIDELQNIDDDSLDETFKKKLRHAKYRFLSLVYPYDRTITELPDDRARDWQTECAIELYNLDELGDEANYAQYSENGLSYARAKAGLSQDLINELPPAKAGVPI